jgi:hypothetical protein
MSTSACRLIIITIIKDEEDEDEDEKRKKERKIKKKKQRLGPGAPDKETRAHSRRRPANPVSPQG